MQIRLHPQNSVRTISLVYLILTAILWSLGGVFIKLVQWHPVAIAGMRSAIAAIFIYIIMNKPKFSWTSEQIFCSIAYASTLISFVIATKMTTAANAILLQYTAPIYVAVFGFIVLKEKTTKVDWLTVGIVMLGMLLFFIDDLDMQSFWGNIFGIISGISFAALVLFLRKQKDESPLDSVILGNIITALIGLPFMFQSMPSVSSWLGLLLLGVIQLGFPYILYAIAIKSVTALEGVIIPVLEPILNPIWVFIFLREIPGKWSIIGGIIVLITVTLRCIYVSLNTSRV